MTTIVRTWLRCLRLSDIRSEHIASLMQRQRFSAPTFWQTHSNAVGSISSFGKFEIWERILTKSFLKLGKMMPFLRESRNHLLTGIHRP